MLKKITKPLFFFIGSLSFVLGVIGIFLPLLPTTPFILLSALCWAKSSVRFHKWLLAHRTFGPMIKNWQKYGSVPRRAKFLAVGMMSISTLYLLIFQNGHAKWMAMIIMLPMAVWMMTRPNSEDNPQ